MTFILNILHSEFSILASDKKAISPSGTEVSEPKLFVYPGLGLSLGIAGSMQYHYYIRQVDLSVNADDLLRKIKTHVELNLRNLRVHERKALRALKGIEVQQGIATFFDQAEDVFFTANYRFSEIESCFRLNCGGTTKVKVLSAGSGSDGYDELMEGDLGAFLSDVEKSRSPEEFIPWITKVFQAVSALDPRRTGPDPDIVLATKSDPTFRTVEVP